MSPLRLMSLDPGLRYRGHLGAGRAAPRRPSPFKANEKDRRRHQIGV